MKTMTSFSKGIKMIMITFRSRKHTAKMMKTSLMMSVAMVIIAIMKAIMTAIMKLRMNWLKKKIKPF